MANSDYTKPVFAPKAPVYYVGFEVTDVAFALEKEQFLEAIKLEIESGTKDMLEYMSKTYDEKKNSNDK